MILPEGLDHLVATGLLLVAFLLFSDRYPNVEVLLAAFLNSMATMNVSLAVDRDVSCKGKKASELLTSNCDG